MYALRRAGLALLLLPFVGCSEGDAPQSEAVGSSQWQTYQDPLGRYSIDLPTTPPTPPRASFAVSLSPRANFAVTVGNTSGLSTTLPAEWQAFVNDPTNQALAQTLLGEHVRQIVDRLKNPENPNRPGENHTVTSNTLIERDGILGADVVLRLDNGHTYTRRLFLTPDHIYEVLANVGAGEVEPEISQRIIDSFYVKPTAAATTAAIPRAGAAR